MQSGCEQRAGPSRLKPLLRFAQQRFVEWRFTHPAAHFRQSASVRCEEFPRCPYEHFLDRSPAELLRS